MTPVTRLRRVDAQSEPALTDEAIARACGAGDAAAIGQLFDRFQRPVARYVHRSIGGGPDVEDLVQATFVEVARGGTIYDGRASVLTWLFAIATNVVRHHRRSKARRTRLMVAVAEARPADAASAERLVSARRQIDRAQAALDSLADELREAFLLCDLEGISARDAGAILGVSEAAVWKRASRAREAIRRVIEGES